MNRASEYSQSLLGTLASAGPDCQVLMLDNGMKRVSLSGSPGFEISFASLSVTPDSSTSGLVDEITPLWHWPSLIDNVDGCKEGAECDCPEGVVGIQRPGECATCCKYDDRRTGASSSAPGIPWTPDISLPAFEGNAELVFVASSCVLCRRGIRFRFRTLSFGTSHIKASNGLVCGCGSKFSPKTHLLSCGVT